MDTRWFKEDRELARKDPTKTAAQHQAETTKVLKNSTLFRNRLERILSEMMDETLRDDEKITEPGWKKRALANAARRKALRDIINLINFKED